MKIYLVQHGEAVSREVNPDRPLSERGRHDVEKLAAFLARLQIRVADLYHSGEVRAAQTAELLQWSVEPHGSPEARAGLAPEDPVAPLAQELSERQADAFVVGHLPFLSRLVSKLVTEREDEAVVDFVPGTVACLEWDRGAWRLIWMVRPELLEA